jgi:hypothetical protein
MPHVHSISVIINARHASASPHVENTHIASMAMTELRSSSSIGGLVTPAGNEVNFVTEIDLNDNFILRAFEYKPSLSNIVFMYCTNGV